jgi:4-amino-4-deoxy-L-arabinose transferase-like glycosyltransferase
MSGATARVSASRPWIPSFAIGASALAVSVVTLLAGGLRLYSLARVPANPFYDAAVRSMGVSWHNFFFAAFEPSGRIAVDKPPLDLWLQVGSVKLLGFNSLALKLPEALAGTLAVPLLYDLVRRVFGHRAGLASALALAVLPVTVLTSRSDTMDTVMMLLIVAAAWLVVHAAQTGRARYLYLAAVVLGLDFNVKLFESLLPLPALVLLYVLASPHTKRRRACHVLVAGLVFMSAALSWVTAVSASPAAARPFPLGSSNGSVWNSTFVFDGLHRFGPAGRHARPERMRNLGPRLQGSNEGGRSPTRLLARAAPALGVSGGSELVPALIFGGLALGLSVGVGRRRSEQGESHSVRRALALAIALWLCLGFVAFSAVGRLQIRYLEAFTPAIAAALGVGLAVIVEGAARPRPGARAALAAAVTMTAAYGLYLAAHMPRLRLLVAGVALAAFLTLLAQVSFRSLRPAGASTLPNLIGVLTLTAALAVPASASVSVVRHHATDASTGSRLPPRTVRALNRFLTSHQGGARYEVATLNAYQAAPLIVRAGRPVLILFNVNRRALLTRRALRAKARAGEVRYVLLGSECGGARGGGRLHAPNRRRKHPLHKCVSTARWVRRHGRPVSVTGRHLGLYRIAPG